MRAALPKGGELFDEDPKAFPDTGSRTVNEVMMGDIVRVVGDKVTLRVEASAQNPIERIEVRNGIEVLETVRGFSVEELGERIRVVWSGAEYRGRGHERKLERHGRDTVVFDAITTGNFGGFDAWLEGQGNDLHITTNHGEMRVPLSEVGIEDVTMDAGGLERKIRVFRLPEANPHRTIATEIDVQLKSEGDNPLWVCVTTEDGFQAWSSPIYAFL